MADSSDGNIENNFFDSTSVYFKLHSQWKESESIYMDLPWTDTVTPVVSKDLQMRFKFNMWKILLNVLYEAAVL